MTQSCEFPHIVDDPRGWAIRENPRRGYEFLFDRAKRSRWHGRMMQPADALAATDVVELPWWPKQTLRRHPYPRHSQPRTSSAAAPTPAQLAVCSNQFADVVLGSLVHSCRPMAKSTLPRARRPANGMPWLPYHPGRKVFEVLPRCVRQSVRRTFRISAICTRVKLQRRFALAAQRPSCSGMMTAPKRSRTSRKSTQSGHRRVPPRTWLRFPNLPPAVFSSPSDCDYRRAMPKLSTLIRNVIQNRWQTIQNSLKSGRSSEPAANAAYPQTIC